MTEVPSIDERLAAIDLRIDLLWETLDAKITPFDQLCRWWKRATPDERTTFLMEVTSGEAATLMGGYAIR
jgi:hypothetical protein